MSLRSRFIAAAVLVLITAFALLLLDSLPVIVLSVSVLAVTATLAAFTARVKKHQRR